MLFAVICTDKADGLALRMETRAAHLEYLETTGVVQAGPFLGEDGKPTGSLVIIETDDSAAAKDWAANDPYSLAGLFSDVRIEQWNKVVG
jgi:uncharacterized protein YciI